METTVLNELTAAELHMALDYDPETGEFTWINPTSRRLKPGDKAGYLHEGYVRIRVGYTKYPAHRLAWLYVHGRWPTGIIDHVNRNRGDNRISNLREADFSTNGANSARRPNRGWPRGVTKSASAERWVAEIKVKGRKRYLGCFETPEAAGAAYQKAAFAAFGEFAGEN